MKFQYFVLLALCGNLVGCDSVHQQVESVYATKKVQSAWKNKELDSAFQASIYGAEVDSQQMAHHLNMGLSLDVMDGDKPKNNNAEKAYRMAIKLSRDSNEKYIAHFNLGQLLGKLKKVDEAIEQYQLALKFKPDSIEAKTNIELLTKQNQGGGQGENKDQKDQKQDQKDQQQNQKDKGDQKDQKKDQDKDESKKGEKPKDPKYENSPKYQPRPFNGKELSENDAKQIINELKNQEQKIRAEYNRRNAKENPRGKDW